MNATPASRPWEIELIDELTAAVREATAGHCQGWPVDDGSLNAAEGLRQTLRLASVGALCFLESDPDYPELVKQQTLRRQTQLPSSDAVYHYARLSGRNTYRIRGNRGSAHVLQFSVWSGSCSNLRDYKLIDKLDSDSCASLEPGTELDLLLSATPQRQPWLRLPPGECEIYVRQYYADWDHEQPAALTIEREGASYPPPPPTAEQIQERIRMMRDWLRTQTSYFAKSVQFHLATDPSRLPQLPIPEAFQDNVYLNGHYRCAPESAVILEVIPPRSVYWGFQLANLQWEAMDYHMRCSSLNFRQAKLDSDGALRIVISHRDPQVPNWFDTSGRTLGLLSGRYYKPVGVPIPTLRTVAFDELHRHLPADTPHVSADARAASLLARRQSVYRRFCGDQ